MACTHLHVSQKNGIPHRPNFSKYYTAGRYLSLLHIDIIYIKIRNLKNSFEKCFLF